MGIEQRTHSNKLIEQMANKVVEIVKERNANYGDENLTRYGHLGLIVRISDKIARIENMKDMEKTEKIVKALRNDYSDIAGYGIMGLKLMKENKL